LIPQDFVDQLLSRVDLVDVVDRYVPLKKAGQNYLACCPFHKEKSPLSRSAPASSFITALVVVRMVPPLALSWNTRGWALSMR
jgi:hypothetical protein